MKTRRDALKAMAVVSAVAPVLQGQHEHAESSAAAGPPAKAVVFNSSQIALIGVLVNHIIPKSDTPGALEAGVPLIVDSMAAGNSAFRKRWMAALGFFGKAKFERMTAEQQVEFLREMQDSVHFRLVKDSTIDAYYSTREGLVTELGWHGNTYLAQFKGCTHPEHHANTE